MKTLYKAFLTLATLAVAASSCVKQEAPAAPGEKDVEGCYGVFFPEQKFKNPLDPDTDSTFFEVKVGRKVTEGAITVPYVVTASADSVITLFKYEDIFFEDGAAETTFRVDFPEAQVGKEYTISFTVTDPQYASKYASKPVGIDIKVFRVAWLKFSEGLMTEGYWGEEEEETMYYYEWGTNIRYCYISNCFDHDTVLGGGEYTPVNYYFYWNTKNNNLFIPWQYMGYSNPSKGNMCFGNEDSFYNSYWDYYYVGQDFIDFCVKFRDKYPADFKNAGYYNKNGDFYLADYYSWTNESGHAVGSGFGFGTQTDVFYAYTDPSTGLPFVRVDYTCELKADFCSDGKLPVDFDLGTDIVSVAVAIEEGEFTATQLNKKFEAIEKGEIESETAPHTSGVRDTTTYIFSDLGKSGIYTIMALGYAADTTATGADTTICVAKNALVVNYVCAADVDTLNVTLHGGIGSAAKYKGVNTDNNLEIFLYGEDIKNLSYAVMNYSAFNPNDPDCLEAAFELLKEDLAATLEEAAKDADVDSAYNALLEAVNGDGYVTIASKLTPGTDFFLVAYAENGYKEDLFVFGPATTTGDPLPIYIDYGWEDYYEPGEWADSSAIIGKTFNYYAVDYFGSLGVREYLGKVTIEDNPDLPNYTDENDDYCEPVIVKGLEGTVSGTFGELLAKNELPLGNYFELCEGCLYHSDNTHPSGACSVNVFSTITGNAGAATWYNCFAPVGDGYWCLLPCETEYQMNAIGYKGSSGYFAVYADCLLVDPEKDDNGVAPKAGAKLSKRNEIEINAAAANRRAGSVVKVNDFKSSWIYPQVAHEPIARPVSFEMTKSDVAPKANAPKEFNPDSRRKF